ncbi:MAG: rhomboid family intramembrane serine protease [Myxococcota bacterium]
MYGRGGYQMGFGPPVTPQVIKNLLIANVAVYVAQILTNHWITAVGAVVPAQVWSGQALWQPFTYMWLHGGLMHIAFNMFALWMFGSPLALTWGDQRFLKYYLVCGVGAGFVIATVPYLFDSPTMIPTLGASGAVMGVLLAYSFTWPDRTIMLMFPPIPIKAIWLIPLILVIEFGSDPHGTSNISHAGHLGGVLVGWIYLIREGRTPGALTLDTLKYRWRRYQMRRKLRSVQMDDLRDRRKRDDERRYH